jgi:hypothetical protein
MKINKKVLRKAVDKMSRAGKRKKGHTPVMTTEADSFMSRWEDTQYLRTVAMEDANEHMGGYSKYY